MTTPSIAASNDALVREFIAATPIVGTGAIRDWVASFAGKPPGRLNVLHQVASERHHYAPG